MIPHHYRHRIRCRIARDFRRGMTEPAFIRVEIERLMKATRAITEFISFREAARQAMERRLFPMLLPKPGELVAGPDVVRTLEPSDSRRVAVEIKVFRTPWELTEEARARLEHAPKLQNCRCVIEPGYPGGEYLD